LGYGAADQTDEQLAGASFRGGRRWLLLGLAVACVGLALAGPMYGEAEVRVQPTGANVIVALDVSLSMAATDTQPSRMARAIHQVDMLLEDLAGYPVGLVVFAGAAYPAVPLTLDHGALKLFLDAVEPGMIPRPGSSLEAAVTMAGRMFGKPDGVGRALIVLSDGETTVGSLEQATRQADKAAMVVYSIGVGEAAGAPIPITDERGRFAGYKRDRDGKPVATRLDASGLTRLAAASGGDYYPSSLDGDELVSISAAVATLAQGEQDSAALSRQENRYQWPLGAAVILLLLESALAPFAGRRAVTS
jgi:Ca-activated chloride channel family protein